MIKFHQYYVTNGKDKVKVHYSLDNRCDGKKCVTVYSREYNREIFKNIFGEIAQNDSDMMTDYFEKSRAVIFEDNPIYKYTREKAEYYIQKCWDRRYKNKKKDVAL